MALLFIFIIGCFVTAIVAVGMVFAMAAVGYGSEGHLESTSARPNIDSMEDS